MAKNGAITSQLDSERKIDKVKNAARLAAIRGFERRTNAMLEERQYSPEEIQAYNQSFDKYQVTPKDQALLKARNAGKKAAQDGYTCATADILKKRNNYSPEQIESYQTAYNQYQGSTQEQGLRKARTAGKKAGKKGHECASANILKKRNNYSTEQVKAYHTAYDQAQVRAQEQAMPKAKHVSKPAVEKNQNTDKNVGLLRAEKAGNTAAYRNAKRPTVEELQSRNNHYSPEHIKVYFDAYDKYKATHEGKTAKLHRDHRSVEIKENNQNIYQDTSFEFSETEAESSNDDDVFNSPMFCNSNYFLISFPKHQAEQQSNNNNHNYVARPLVNRNKLQTRFDLK